MSTYKEKVNRIKKWSSDHEEALVFGGLITFVVVLGYFTVKAEMSFSEQKTAELNYYVDQLNEMYTSALMATPPDMDAVA